jgi:serine/threonine protein kinase
MMEYMDLGTLESIYQKTGPVPEKWVSVIAFQILSGLMYLFEKHKIVHRGTQGVELRYQTSKYSPDIKGKGKAGRFWSFQGNCRDFGHDICWHPMLFISITSLMKPERIIRNAPCTPKSDVWALALTMMEVAMAKLPFPKEAMNSYFDLMQYITQEQSPTLPPEVFSSEFQQYCEMSLIKDPEARANPQALTV